jgi:hypothetical protein
MRTCEAVAWLLLMITGAVCGGAPGVHGAEAVPASAPVGYKQLRYDEDYRFLQDPSRRQDPLDPLKYIELGPGGWYLTLGGEVRERYEYFHNSQWGAGPQDDGGYLLQRYMLHADVHASEHVRIFLQVKSAIESGRNGGPRPTDEDRLDAHQGFIDFENSWGDDLSLTGRVGRQELQYGTARIVSAREGPNVRQSFDAVKLIARTGAWRADAFLGRPVETDVGVFDDGWDPDRAFWGVYASGPLRFVGDASADLYYLGLERRGAQFDQGEAHELRHSLGLRLFGRPQPWDYNFEAIGQVGSFGGARIAAWTVASDTGYTLTLPASPRLALKADIASGDRDPYEASLQTFNALFPRGAYFSETALIGPANFIDVHPAIELRPARGVLVYADWDFFWRQSTHDGLYGVAVNLVRSGTTTDARYIGSQIQAGIEWAFLRHFTLVAIYAHFFAGPFLSDTGPARDVDFVTVWTTFKF